jgi:hypothetical protein
VAPPAGPRFYQRAVLGLTLSSAARAVLIHQAAHRARLLSSVGQSTALVKRGSSVRIRQEAPQPRPSLKSRNGGVCVCLPQPSGTPAKQPGPSPRLRAHSASIWSSRSFAALMMSSCPRCAARPSKETTAQRWTFLKSPKGKLTLPLCPRSLSQGKNPIVQAARAISAGKCNVAETATKRPLNMRRITWGYEDTSARQNPFLARTTVHTGRRGLRCRGTFGVCRPRGPRLMGACQHSHR